MNTKAYIGNGCYLYFSSEAELVRAKDNERIQLTPTEYRLLAFFLDNEERAITLEELAKVLWGVNYEADEKDPESIKSHLTRLRNKLHKIEPALRLRLQTNYGFNSYTFKKDSGAQEKTPVHFAVDHFDPYAESFDLSNRIDALVAKMEHLQQKIDLAQSNQSDLWVQIYSTQFQTTLSVFMQLQRESEEMRRQVLRVRDSICYSNKICESFSVQGMPNTVLCRPNEHLEALRNLSEVKSWIDTSAHMISGIEEMVDAAICQYINSSDCEDDMLISLLDILPTNRNVALCLVELTASYDGVYELWDTIFDRYANYLTPDEMNDFANRAKRTWDTTICNLWGV